METKKAFTLIELLVTLAIIAILVTISTFGLQRARSGSRDEKRKSDLEMMRAAIELYYSDYHEYPPYPLPNPGQPFSRDGKVYLPSMPADPQAPTYKYSYWRYDLHTYELCASLEVPPAINPGCRCACGSGPRCCNYKSAAP